MLPHAIPELTALFLPLAAWLIASRRGEWNQLLAATFVTVAIAIPVLVVAADDRGLRLAPHPPLALRRPLLALYLAAAAELALTDSDAAARLHKIAAHP